MPDSRADLRKRCVQGLRAVARKCQVELIRDTAARDKVKALAQAIADSDGSADLKAEAAATFTRYEETWPREETESSTKTQK